MLIYRTKIERVHSIALFWSCIPYCSAVAAYSGHAPPVPNFTVIIQNVWRLSRIIFEVLIDGVYIQHGDNDFTTQLEIGAFSIVKLDFNLVL